MRSYKLEAALMEFLEDAARFLQTDVECGSEIPFELERRGSSPARTALYCYRPLTSEFMGQRWRALGGLESHARASAALEAFEGLDRFLAARGASRGPSDARAGKAQVALWILLEEVFAEQSDFGLNIERAEHAIERLEDATEAGTFESTVVATLHGMTISSASVPLVGGLQIVQPGAVEGMPEEVAPVGPTDRIEHLLVTYACQHADAGAAVADARAALRDLLGALRLFGDGRVSLGALAWTRVADGRWRPFALGEHGRPHGMLVVTEAQEDELRAFCSLVSRRAPDGNALAWALGRFQMGCSHANPYEALSDYLLALRALLEPDGSPRGSLAGRLAALCAVPEERPALRELVIEAIELERTVIDGTAGEVAGAERIIRVLADHLRALLRDVVCGHLDADLAGYADSLLAEGTREGPAGDRDAGEDARRPLFRREIGARDARPGRAGRAAPVRFERTPPPLPAPALESLMFEDDGGDEQLRITGTAR
ncbi:MAG: hypothetical protein KGJ43_07220 [Acidobacteriota bacterium]|nr:hypothetical protein [Acidobacteriota bacterium]